MAIGPRVLFMRFAIFVPMAGALLLFGMGVAVASPRQYEATRAKVAPQIDGRLDDACWQNAVVLDGFSQFSQPDVLHPEPTIGRVCFDDDHLYIALACEVAEMDKFRARFDEAEGRFEYSHAGVVEIFFDLNHDRETFQQYMLHANGSTKITLPRGDILRILNDATLVAKATINDSGYIVEAAFPLAMLHLNLDTKNVWGFNLNRAHDLYDERFERDSFFSSWNSTEGQGFQSPEKFGELVINADLSPFFWRVDLEAEPAVGDRTVALRVVNETGMPFRGDVRLAIGQSAEDAQPLVLESGKTQRLRFDHVVTAADAEAEWRVTITDGGGRVRYLGGTQKRDTTQGDDWAAPAANGDEQRAGFIAFQRPYTTEVLYRAVPRRDEVVSELEVTACRGEFEPSTVALYPLRDVEALSVTVSDLNGPDGAAITADQVVTRVVQWQSKWEDPSAFEAFEHLLPRFDTLPLVQHRTRRLWLTVQVPENAVPGIYRGGVTLRADGVDTHLPLVLTVLPFELLRPEGMGYFMYFPGVKHPSISNYDYLKMIARDMRDHGMSTFTIYHWVEQKHPDTGAFFVDVDEHVSETLGVTYSELLTILGEAGLGVEAPLLDVYSMHYQPDQIVALDTICRERGWPEVLFYIEDEIEYPDRIAKARKTLEAIRKISPDIRTTTALGSVGAAALGHMYDVWIGCSTPKMVSRCLAKNKAPWTYSCRAVYEVDGAFQRAFYGRAAWKLGLRGVGLWSYAEDKAVFDRLGRMQTYADAPVFMPEYTKKYGHVHLEPDEVVPSVTWEAVREGIDDYRYFWTLKKMAEALHADADPARRRRAEAAVRLLDEIAQRTPIISDDKKFGRHREALGDSDAERGRVIEAIMGLQK